MAVIVNLRLARKRKARAEKEEVAQRNRLAHGRTKAEKEHERLAAEKSRKLLDDHLRE
jgi:hypothetical protein